MQFSLEYKNLLHRSECSMFAQIELFAKNESLLDVLESFFVALESFFVALESPLELQSLPAALPCNG